MKSPISGDWMVCGNWDYQAGCGQCSWRSPHLYSFAEAQRALDEHRAIHRPVRYDY